MLAIALFVILGVLILLERLKKINLSNMAAGIFMMVSASVLVGLYVNELAKTILALIANAFEIESEAAKAIYPMYESMSNATIAIRLVLMVILFLPFAAGILYILQALIRRPLKICEGESLDEYSRRLGVRNLDLGIAAAVCFIICLAVMICVLVPYAEIFIESLALFNPALILFMIIFTCGIGLFWLAGMFTVINSAAITILIAFFLVCTAFYLFSVLLGIAGCIRGKKIGKISGFQTLIYIVLSFMIGWNFIPFISLRKKLKA